MIFAQAVVNARFLSCAELLHNLFSNVEDLMGEIISGTKVFSFTMMMPSAIALSTTMSMKITSQTYLWLGGLEVIITGLFGPVCSL